MSTIQQEVGLVDKLRKVQLEKLKMNRDRGHWSEGSGINYLDRIGEKMRDLRSAYAKSDRAMAWNYAADIANLAAMVAEEVEANS